MTSGEKSPSEVTQMKPIEALTRGFEFSSADVQKTGASLSSLVAPADFGLESHRLAFLAGGVGMMIYYEAGSELTELPLMHHLPHAPSWFMGMVNLHGRLVPVFDLSVYMGLEYETPAKPMLLVLGHGADATGIVIDEVPRRLAWEKNEESGADLAPGRLQPHVRGSCLIEGDLWFDLDAISLCDALESALATDL